jgi:phytol kinase
MGTQIALTSIVLTAIAALLIFNEMMYRRLGTKGEVTRKFAHFTATLSTIIFPYIFNSHWYVLVLAVIFFLILFISRNGIHLKSIHDIDRKSYGSYLLPLSIYLTFLISFRLDNKFMFILPILILAVCDPMAGILGLNIKRNNKNIVLLGIRTKKTLLGSGSFLVSAFIISVISLYFYYLQFDLKTFWLALGIATLSAAVELVSWRGTDNLTIPMSVLLMLILFL